VNFLIEEKKKRNREAAAIDISKVRKGIVSAAVPNRADF
jgi:hypothetical protein